MTAPSDHQAWTKEASETQALASSLATVLVDGDLLVLLGDLGAGKTCFTKGLAEGLAISDPITSPTFTLLNRYAGRLPLNHIDAYRLEGNSVVDDLDLYELAEEGVTVIEWGHNILQMLPEQRLEISLAYSDDDDDGRELQIQAFGESWLERGEQISLLLLPWSQQ